MSDQNENPPNEESQMATSLDETNQENPGTPQEESNPEEAKQEEEEEDEKSVRNPRNVALEGDSLAPYLVKLEHDQETQLGFLKCIKMFRRINKEYPCEREEAMEDFFNNWLEVRVPWLDFQQTLQRLRRRYVETGSSIRDNLKALSPEDRELFLMGNRILFAYYTEQRDKKRKLQETYGAMTSSSNKEVKINGSHAPPKKEPEKGLTQYKAVEPEKGVKQYKAVEPEKGAKQRKEVDKKWEMVIENRKLKMRMFVDTKKEKLKQKKPKYQEKEVVESIEKPTENPEEQKRDNPPEEKPSESPEEDEEVAWSEANYDTLMSILSSLGDYNFLLDKLPYDDANDMEDFVKNWLKVDVSISDCLEVIKRLKKNYVKKFWVAMDHGLHFRNQKEEDLYNNSDVLWRSEADMVPDDEEEEKEEKDSGDEGGGSLKRKHPDAKKRLDFSEPDYDPAMRPLLPFLIRSTFEQNPGTVPDFMPEENPVPLDMIRKPIIPVFRFQETKKRYNNQQKTGSGKPVPRIIVRPRFPRISQFRDIKRRYKIQLKAGRGEASSSVKKYVPQTILRGVLPPPPGFREKEDTLRRPIPPVPRFQDTKKEDKNQQKGGSGEDSSSVNRTDQGGFSSQDDDPEPHNENPEGGSEAPEEPKSGGEKMEDTMEE